MPILIDFDGSNYISAPLPITMCFNTQRQRAQKTQNSNDSDNNNNNNNNNNQTPNNDNLNSNPNDNQNQNSNNNNNNDKKASKPRLRKIFTTQTPHENREYNRYARHKHKTPPSHDPPAPNSSRGYIVHSRKHENVNVNQSQSYSQQHPNQSHIPKSAQSQMSNPNNSNSNVNNNVKQNYQNVRKITSNKKYRFITPLFILEVWHEKHAISDSIGNANNNNNNNNNSDKKPSNRNMNHIKSRSNSTNANGSVQYIQYDIGNFYTLSLNLDAIVHSWGSARDRQLPLLNFLLNRETYQSKRIILKMLFEMIEYYCLGYKYDVRSKLDCVSEYFVTINQVLRRAVEESAIMLSFCVVFVYLCCSPMILPFYVFV